MKAIRILKDIKIDDLGLGLELNPLCVTDDICQAIEEIEKLQNENKSLVKTLEKYNEEMIVLRKENQDLKSRSCENCYESETCKILHSVYKDRLKKEGYAMHKNEFKCGFWHSLF